MIPLLRATHFEPTVAVTLLAAGLAVVVGRGWGSLLVAAAVLAGQCSVGWSNDWIDRERDVAAHRADKPLVAGTLRAETVRRAALVALAACVVLSLAAGVAGGLVHLVAVALAWGYNLGLKRTPLSVVPYALAFGLLPAFVTLGLPGRPWPTWWAMAGSALLGSGAHFLNALPDLREDVALGVRGLPQRLGPQGSLLTGAVVLGAGAALTSVAPGLTAPRLGALILALALTGLIVRLGTSDARRTAFKLALVVAVVAIGTLLTAGPDLVSRA